jgi:hypothetical protein
VSRDTPGIEPMNLILDDSEWDSGAQFAGFQHPELPIMWRVAAHPKPNPSGWALLDLRGRPYPHVLESGVMTEREARALVRHRESPNVRRRAARAIDRAIASGALS